VDDNPGLVVPPELAALPALAAGRDYDSAAAHDAFKVEPVRFVEAKGV
jgi:hypothetical protein